MTIRLVSCFKVTSIIITIRLVSCINVRFCSDVDCHDHRLVSCMNVSFCSDVDHHDHKVGLLLAC